MLDALVGLVLNRLDPGRVDDSAADRDRRLKAVVTLVAGRPYLPGSAFAHRVDEIPIPRADLGVLVVMPGDVGAATLVELEVGGPGIVALGDPRRPPGAGGGGELDPTADTLAHVGHGRGALVIQRERRLDPASERRQRPALAGRGRRANLGPFLPAAATGEKRKKRQ